MPPSTLSRRTIARIIAYFPWRFSGKAADVCLPRNKDNDNILPLSSSLPFIVLVSRSLFPNAPIHQLPNELVICLKYATHRRTPNVNTNRSVNTNFFVTSFPAPVYLVSFVCSMSPSNRRDSVTSARDYHLFSFLSSFSPV